MSENEKKNVNEMGADEMLAAYREEHGDERPCADPRMGSTEGRRKDGIEELLDTLKDARAEAEKAADERLRREGRDSLAIGGVCCLGVVSLLAAAWTGVWVPVALGLGICLSAAGGILIYRGMVVLRG